MLLANPKTANLKAGDKEQIPLDKNISNAVKNLIYRFRIRGGLREKVCYQTKIDKAKNQNANVARKKGNSKKHD